MSTLDKPTNHRRNSYSPNRGQCYSRRTSTSPESKKAEPDTSSDDTLSALAARLPQDTEVPDDIPTALAALKCPE